jgi:hypothetical protein
MLETAYLMVTGAGIAGDVTPPLILGLAARFPSVLVLPTPNASRVLNLRDISRLGQQIADGRPPPARPAAGPDRRELPDPGHPAPATVRAGGRASP